MTSKKRPNSPAGNPDTVCQVDARVAAARCLKKRLRAVHRWLKRVRQDWEEGPEPVHQLRVSTRRARVAVQLFAKLLSPDDLDWAERYLKRLRKKAGDARDWDVLLERVATPPLKQAISKKQRARLQMYLQDQRRLAQVPLQSETRKSKRQRLRVHSGRLLDHLEKAEPSESLTLLELARTELRPLVESFLAQTAIGLASIEQIHQIRIAGKHVRYAMEVFTPAFPTSFRAALYTTFCELQEKLGAINDHATAMTKLGSLLPTSDEKINETLQKIIAAEQAAMDQRVERLRATWRPATLNEIANQFAAYLET